ncbi:MAG: amino acid-binding protein [Candidatus Thorarchaeota archaeon]
MWQLLAKRFHDSPQRLRVAQAIIRHGFRVAGVGDVRCGDIRIPLKSLGDAFRIDRRTVRATTEIISKDPELQPFFANLKPAGPSLERVAHLFGFGIVVIFVKDPENSGILSEVATTIASYGISIRQVIAEDAGVYSEPCLKVITQEELSGGIINALTGIRGVSRVVIQK